MSNLNLNFKSRYGLDWPENVPDPFIELTLAKKYRFDPFCQGDLLPPHEHMLKAIRALLPPDFFVVNRWTEMMVKAWCEEDFSVWLGAASCGKSHTAGMLAVLDFITDPDCTYVALASTTVPMLKLRSFASCTETLRLLKNHPSFSIPLKEAPSQTAIINDRDAGASDASLKAAVRGVAVGEGSEAKAVARLAGVHTKFVTIILDEGSALPEAAAKARINASAGTQRFRFLSLANPVDRNDEATRFCEPLDGWSSVNVDTEEWRSNFGKVLHFNAMNSPALQEDDGESLYPFLLSRRQIDTIIREAGGNTEDPMVYRMVYGYPAPMGGTLSVLTERDIDTFGLADDAVFDGRGDKVQRVASLDPAFTGPGGDGCAFRWGEIGYDNTGRPVLQLRPCELLAIDPDDGQPAAYQVAQQTIQRCNTLGIPVSALAVDDSGTQSVAAIIQHESGIRPIACNFAERADDNKQYRNRVTEIWFSLQALARNYQLRGLDSKTALQLCARRFKKADRPLALESKAEYKKRTGLRSPDEADATALLAYAALRTCGLCPGSEQLSLRRDQGGEVADQQVTSLDSGYELEIDVDFFGGGDYSDPNY